MCGGSLGLIGGVVVEGRGTGPEVGAVVLGVLLPPGYGVSVVPGWPSGGLGVGKRCVMVGGDGFSGSSPGRRSVGAFCFCFWAGFCSATSVSFVCRSTSFSVRTILLPSTVMISRRATSLPLKRTKSTSSGGLP